MTGSVPTRPTGPVMPGERMGHRPLHFMWVIDASGSMSGTKIESLNTAIREVIPVIQKEAEEWPEVDLSVAAIVFSAGARWLGNGFEPIDSYKWAGVTANGVTDMGHAMNLIAAYLRDKMPERAIPPVIVLMSDGQPTDDFSSGVKAVLAEPWGRKAVRLAIAIGDDADQEVLKQFVANPERPVILASNPEQLVQAIRWASTTVTKSVASGRSKEGTDLDPAIPAPPPIPIDSQDKVW